MKNLTVLTLNQKNITDFAAARNQLLATALTEWVLFVDQDEQISPALQIEIELAIRSTRFVGYYLKRQDSFLGSELHYGETGNLKLLRLARRDYGKWIRPVHEIWVGLPAVARRAKVGELKNPLFHHSHQSISAFLAKIDHYSSIEAQYRYSQKIRPTLFQLIFYPAGKFLKNYLVLQGFRDGIPGLIMAIMMSFHSYLTWTKLYLLWRQK